MYFDQEKFGCRIRLLRKKRGMTQEQLASALRISTDHLGKIELGKRGISIDLLLELSEIFKVPLDFLVKGKAGKYSEWKEIIEQIRYFLDQLEEMGKNQA